MAISTSIQIANTDGEGVLIRTEPNASSTRLGWMPEGASPAYNCFVSGQLVEGVPVWFEVSYEGVTGFYASYYDTSSYQSNEELTAKYGVPLCGSVGPAQPSPPQGSTPQASTTPAAAPSAALPNAFYDRSAAVSWALANAKDPQAFTAMCTWFLSNALWAGGFPKSPEWTSAGRYGKFAPGTKDAWWLPSFLAYLRGHYSTTFTNITSDLHTNAVPGAEPGDLIVYDWGEGEGLSHVAMVVNIASGDYPEVAEMGQYDLNAVDSQINRLFHVSSSYEKRGWTWSAVHHEWLQREHASMKAYLLHINGGYTSATY
jgi:hypothetical protein